MQWSDKKGYVDLLIEGCNKDIYTVLEFKVAQIDCLELTGKSADERAERLKGMPLEEILRLRFNESDKFRPGKTIHDLVDGKADENGKGKESQVVREQLQSYIKGCTVQKEIAGKNFRAFAVVIIGSRQILMREMDRNGEWVGEYELA